MSGEQEKEMIGLNLGKTSKLTCEIFDKFVEAFQGNVLCALDFLSQRHAPTNASMLPEPEQDLIVKAEKHAVASLYDAIDTFISKHKLQSRAEAVEMLVMGSGIEWQDDGTIKFMAQHCSLQLMEKLSKGRLEKTFCDVEIVTGESGRAECFAAHKCVLAASSDYFTNILRGNTKVVQVCGLEDFDIFGQMLDYIYTGAIIVNKENSSQIFQMAKFFAIETLENLCKEYFVLSHEEPKLDELARDFAVKIIDDVAKQQCTLEISRKPNHHAPLLKSPSSNGNNNTAMPQVQTSSSDTEVVVTATSHDSQTNRRLSIRTCTSQFACQLCQADFKTKSNLKRHMLTHTGERKHCCTTCGKLFLKADHLTRHEYTHSTERPFICEKCEKKFKTRDNLKRHLLTHTEERPFCCEICAKTFKDKSALVVHQKSHNRAEVVCSHCGKCFTQRNRLAYHMLQHTQPPSCATCGKTFKFPTQLQRHMKTHTGDRPFSCETCGQQFIDSHSLKLHQRRHSGLGLHACPNCGRKFLDKYHLNRHMKMHTGEKPFKCNLCQKQFSRADNCESHKKGCTVKVAMKNQARFFADRAEWDSPHDGLIPRDKVRKLLPVKMQEKRKAAEETQKRIQNFALAVNENEINNRRFQRIAKKPPELKLVIIKKHEIASGFGSHHQAPTSPVSEQPALFQIVNSTNASQAENTRVNRTCDSAQS